MHKQCPLIFSCRFPVFWICVELFYNYLVTSFYLLSKVYRPDINCFHTKWNFLRSSMLFFFISYNWCIPFISILDCYSIIHFPESFQVTIQSLDLRLVFDKIGTSKVCLQCCSLVWSWTSTQVQPRGVNLAIRSPGPPSLLGWHNGDLLNRRLKEHPFVVSVQCAGNWCFSDVATAGYIGSSRTQTCYLWPGLSCMPWFSCFSDH